MFTGTIRSIGKLLLASACLISVHGICHADVQNRYYFRATALELFDNPDAYGNVGRVRGVNALNEVDPSYKEFWTRRWFRAKEYVPVYSCEWGFVNCTYVASKWYKAIQLKDFVVVDAVDYIINGKRVREAFVVYLWR